MELGELGAVVMDRADYLEQARNALARVYTATVAAYDRLAAYEETGGASLEPAEAWDPGEGKVVADVETRTRGLPTTLKGHGAGLRIRIRKTITSTYDLPNQTPGDSLGVTRTDVSYTLELTHPNGQMVSAVSGVQGRDCAGDTGEPGDVLPDKDSWGGLFDAEGDRLVGVTDRLAFNARVTSHLEALAGIEEDLDALGAPPSGALPGDPDATAPVS